MLYPHSSHTPFRESSLTEHFKTYIETHFYVRVSEQSVLEAVRKDPDFLQDPIRHVALYTDHGVVHVRDVARQIVQVLDTIHGVLIPERPVVQWDFMKGYGVAVAYLHDMGMRDFSADGRFMHPEFAAQIVFSEEFAPLIQELWEVNAGNMAWRLLNLHRNKILSQAPQQVLKEILSLSMCHSKSKVPITLLNDPHALRTHVQACMGTKLELLCAQQRLEKAQAKLEAILGKGGAGPALQEQQTAVAKAQQEMQRVREALSPEAQRNLEARAQYADFEGESFQWLVDPHPELRAFVADVVDTLRALRSADALRQRGTVLRTSAGYEIFVDQLTGHAIFALRSQDNKRLFLLEGQKPLNAGEANIASSEVDKVGNLRISFHWGLFADAEATQRAVFNAATAVEDIQADVLQSFVGVKEGEDANSFRSVEDVSILLEQADDNPRFAGQVREALYRRNPALQGKVKLVASLHDADLQEVLRYLAGDDIRLHYPPDRFVVHISPHLAGLGLHLDLHELARALEEVKYVLLQPGDTLIESGSPSGFVYIPMNEGLTVTPLGGYASVPAKAWVPLGNTGVIRGSERNAEVVARREVALIVIPKQVYLEHWYKKYTVEEFGQTLREAQ